MGLLAVVVGLNREKILRAEGRTNKLALGKGLVVRAGTWGQSRVVEQWGKERQKGGK